MTGIDTSLDMLEAARRHHPGIEFVTGDIATWSPTDRYDLVFSNVRCNGSAITNGCCRGC